MRFKNIFKAIISKPGIIKKWITKETIILLCYMAASAMSLNVFMQTRSFEEGSKIFGLSAMLDGSADRPYVYRQLLPIIANYAVMLIPEQDRDSFVKYHFDKYHLKQQYFGRAKYQNKDIEIWTPSYAIKYHIIYAANFISLLGLAYILRYIVKEVSEAGAVLSIVAPIMFLLLLPLSFMHGNFYYDFPELFFLATLLATAFANKYIWWILLLPLAVLNKESNILVPILYLPIIFMGPHSMRKNLIIVLATTLGFTAFFYIKTMYTTNPGGEMIWQLWKNLDFWQRPMSYFLWKDFYVPGIPFPRGLNFIFVLVICSLLSTAWKDLSTQLQRLLLVAFVVNVPLWLLFCHNDEMRNLSFIFLPLFIAATKAIENLFQSHVCLNA